MSARRYYELRRLRPHGLDSEELGTFGTEAQARAAMAAWRKDTDKLKWQFRISLITVDAIHDDVFTLPSGDLTISPDGSVQRDVCGATDVR